MKSRSFSLFGRGIKVLQWLVAALFLVSIAVLCKPTQDVWTPVASFSERYNESENIVAGEIIGIEDTEELVPVFSGFPKKYVKIVTMRVERSWKGVADKVRFYAFISRAPNLSMERRKISSATLAINNNYIIYLRNIGGKRVSQDSFGIFRYYPGELPLEKTNEFSALEAMRKGEGLEKAVSYLSDHEQRAYSKAAKQ